MSWTFFCHNIDVANFNYVCDALDDALVTYGYTGGELLKLYSTETDHLNFAFPMDDYVADTWVFQPDYIAGGTAARTDWSSVSSTLDDVGIVRNDVSTWAWDAENNLGFCGDVTFVTNIRSNPTAPHTIKVPPNLLQISDYNFVVVCAPFRGSGASITCSLVQNPGVLWDVKRGGILRSQRTCATSCKLESNGAGGARVRIAAGEVSQAREQISYIDLGDLSEQWSIIVGQTYNSAVVNGVGSVLLSSEIKVMAYTADGVGGYDEASGTAQYGTSGGSGATEVVASATHTSVSQPLYITQSGTGTVISLAWLGYQTDEVLEFDDFEAIVTAFRMTFTDYDGVSWVGIGTP